MTEHKNKNNILKKSIYKAIWLIVVLSFGISNNWTITSTATPNLMMVPAYTPPSEPTDIKLNQTLNQTLNAPFGSQLPTLINPVQTPKNNTLNPELFINHIRNSVVPSGAISMYGHNPIPASRKIVPYWSNLAVCGLATEIKFGNGNNKQELTQIAWNALNWYRSKQRPNSGIVHDHIAFAGREVSTGEMDSVDSYSATFLMGLSCMQKATGDNTKIREFLPAMRLAIKSIKDLQDKDGLTWAKPNFKIKYLMDNIEVINGLDEARKIFLSQREVGSYYTTTGIIQNIELGINTKMWSQARNSYRWAIAGDIGAETYYFTNWKTYYPDALENIWPTAFAVNQPKSRTNSVMTTFADNLANYIDSGSIKGLWNPFVGLAYYNHGNTNLSKQSLEYGFQMVNNDQMGGTYTTGHSGLFINLYYKTVQGSSLIW